MSNWVKYYKGNPFIPKDFQEKKKNVARHCPLLVNDTHCLQLLENKRKYIFFFFYGWAHLARWYFGCTAFTHTHIARTLNMDHAPPNIPNPKCRVARLPDIN